jgi:hypothetical protein
LKSGWSGGSDNRNLVELSTLESAACDEAVVTVATKHPSRPRREFHFKALTRDAMIVAFRGFGGLSFML